MLPFVFSNPEIGSAISVVKNVFNNNFVTFEILFILFEGKVESKLLFQINQFWAVLNINRIEYFISIIDSTIKKNTKQNSVETIRLEPCLLNRVYCLNVATDGGSNPVGIKGIFLCFFFVTN